MAISDNSPERRNLVVTSLAFVVFYAAGGHIRDAVVTLAVVNVNFDRPEVLSKVAWALLIWFAIRFFQSTRGKFSQAFKAEIEKGHVPSFWAKKASETYKALASRPPQVPNVVVNVTRPQIRYGKLTMTCAYKYLNDGVPTHAQQQDVVLPRTLNAPFLVHAFFRNAVLDNAAAEYIFPYVGFLVAVTGPIWRCLLWG